MATGALHHPVIRLQVEHWQNICSLMNTFKMLITVTLQNIEISSNSPWSSSCYRCIGWHIFFVNLFYLKRLVVISWNRNPYGTSAFLVNYVKILLVSLELILNTDMQHLAINDATTPDSLAHCNDLCLSLTMDSPCQSHKEEQDVLMIVGHQQQDIKWNICCIHFQSRCVQLSTFYPHVGTKTIYGEERVLSILTSGQLPYTYAICAQRYTHAIYGPDFASEYKSVYTLTTGLPVYGRLWTPWYGRSPHLRLDSGRLDADIDKATSGRSLHPSLLLSGQPWCLASMKHTASTTFDSNVPNSKRK